MQAPDPIAFSILGIDIRWYGVLVGLGFLLGILISAKRAPSLGIEPDHVMDFALFMIPLAIIGARAYYVIFEWEYYAGDIRKILDIRSGGLAIHGGLIAGLLVGVAVCKYHKINLLDFIDLIFPQVALGQSIGRWGNFFNSEAHGGPTDLPWAIVVDGEKVHPTFLYESIWCFLLFFFLLYMTKHRKFKGQIALLYIILYSAERFLVEGLRTDSLMIGGFKQAQVLSACAIAVALVLYVVLSKRGKVEAAPKAELKAASPAGGKDDAVNPSNNEVSAPSSSDSEKSESTSNNGVSAPASSDSEKSESTSNNGVSVPASSCNEESESPSAVKGSSETERPATVNDNSESESLAAVKGSSETESL